MVAAEAQLSGAITVRRFAYRRSRCTSRSEAMPLPPSDLTSSATPCFGPQCSSTACSAITSLSQTEPPVDIQ